MGTPAQQHKSDDSELSSAGLGQTRRLTVCLTTTVDAVVPSHLLDWPLGWPIWLIHALARFGILRKLDRCSHVYTTPEQSRKHVRRAAMRKSKNHGNSPSYHILNKIDEISIAPKRFKISRNYKHFCSEGTLIFDFPLEKNIFPGLSIKKAIWVTTRER